MRFDDPYNRRRTPPRPQEAALLAALSDQAALRLLGLLAERSASAREVAEGLGIPLATAYRQLHRLETGGLVQVERSAFTREGKRYELYRATVSEATVH
ncbi:MAG TPA: helix-turn-helix domain-containing protein, partial [Candidatus Thermoplasmatota archaeon]|nr:helix-turn-helix domain-containing protein [Candidatus Thermoplasmatota archaeon]